MVEFKGRGLVLVTGLMGAGKTHLCVSAIAQIIKDYPEQNIYSDITGLNIKGVQVATDDWRELPENSTIFYDEAQFRDYFASSSRHINSDERVRELTLIRKSNKDIVLITQEPQQIHSAIRKIVQTHYHCWNPSNNLNETTVFEAKNNTFDIDNKGRWKDQATDKHKHKLDDAVFELYDSIKPDAKHAKKRVIPKKIIRSAIALAIAIPIILFAGYWGVSTMFGSQQSMIDQAEGNAPANTEQQTQHSSQSTQPAALPPAVTRNPVITTNELYDKRHDSYFREIVYNEDLRPSMVILAVSSTGKTSCRASNSYGEPLNIPNEQCMLMAEQPRYIPRSRIKQTQEKTIDNDLESNNTQTDFKAPLPDVV